MVDKRTYHGQEAEVIVADNIEEVDQEQPLHEQVETDNSGTKYTGDVMDIDINDPEAGVDIENTFGGQYKVETPSEGVEIDVTMRFRDMEIFEEMHGEAESVGDTEFKRVSGTLGPGQRMERAFLFKLDKDGDKINYLANNALFQQMGEVSLDADGFAEISGTIVALVEDRHIEQNF